MRIAAPHHLLALTARLLLAASCSSLPPSPQTQGHTALHDATKPSAWRPISPGWQHHHSPLLTKDPWTPLDPHCPLLSAHPPYSRDPFPSPFPVPTPPAVTPLGLTSSRVCRCGCWQWAGGRGGGLSEEPQAARLRHPGRTAQPVPTLTLPFLSSPPHLSAPSPPPAASVRLSVLLSVHPSVSLSSRPPPPTMGSPPPKSSNAWNQLVSCSLCGGPFPAA